MSGLQVFGRDVVLGVVVSSQARDEAREEDDGKKVGDGHHAQGCVAKAPDELEGDDGTEEMHGDEDDLVGDNGSVAEEIVCATFAVVGPADCRREGEEEHADCDELAAKRKERPEASLEGAGRERATVFADLPTDLCREDLVVGVHDCQVGVGVDPQDGVERLSRLVGDRGVVDEAVVDDEAKALVAARVKGVACSFGEGTGGGELGVSLDDAGRADGGDVALLVEGELSVVL